VLVYASGLGVALAMRHPVLVRVAPDRASQAALFTADAEGRIVNRYRMTLANRTNERAEVVFEAQGLRGAWFSRGRPPIALAPGEELRGDFDIAVPPGALRPGPRSLSACAASGWGATRPHPRGSPHQSNGVIVPL
jgi:hypothetical protein